MLPFFSNREREDKELRREVEEHRVDKLTNPLLTRESKMNKTLSLYRGELIGREVVKSSRLTAALSAQLGVPYNEVVPLQIRVELSEFKDLTEHGEWIPCTEFDQGRVFDTMIAEYIVAQIGSKTYLRCGEEWSEVNLCAPDEQRLLLTFLCPDLSLNAKLRKKDKEHLRTAPPQHPKSRRIWRLENCIVCGIEVYPLSESISPSAATKVTVNANSSQAE